MGALILFLLGLGEYWTLFIFHLFSFDFIGLLCRWHGNLTLFLLVLEINYLVSIFLWVPPWPCQRFVCGWLVVEVLAKTIKPCPYKYSWLQVEPGQWVGPYWLWYVVHNPAVAFFCVCRSGADTIQEKYIGSQALKASSCFWLTQLNLWTILLISSVHM